MPPTADATPVLLPKNSVSTLQDFVTIPSINGAQPEKNFAMRGM
jgi:hypothetical protein